MTERATAPAAVRMPTNVDLIQQGSNIWPYKSCLSITVRERTCPNPVAGASVTKITTLTLDDRFVSALQF